MAQLIPVWSIKVGMQIADPVFNERGVKQMNKYRVQSVEFDACRRGKVHINRQFCYEETAEVWKL